MCNFVDRDFLVGSWNVRSLVECSGDAHICRNRPVSVAASVNVDCKLYFWLKH